MVKEKLEKLNKKVDMEILCLTALLLVLQAYFDDSMEKEIKSFFKNNPTPGTERTQKQTLERIRINSKFLRTMRKEFKNG